MNKKEMLLHLLFSSPPDLFYSSRDLNSLMGSNIRLPHILSSSTLFSQVSSLWAVVLATALAIPKLSYSGSAQKAIRIFSF